MAETTEIGDSTCGGARCLQLCRMVVADKPIADSASTRGCFGTASRRRTVDQTLGECLLLVDLRCRRASADHVGVGSRGRESMRNRLAAIGSVLCLALAQLRAFSAPITMQRERGPAFPMHSAEAMLTRGSKLGIGERACLSPTDVRTGCE